MVLSLLFLCRLSTSGPIYISGVVWDGSCAEVGVFPALLSEQVEPGAILPLQAMHDDPMCHHPGPPDAPVCVPHQSDDNPTVGVSACPSK